jgi:hypothetical protein
MSDLNFQNLSTVQSNQQPGPPTIASAATIAPQTFMTYVSGVAAIVNIIPPVTGQHMLVLIPTGAWTTTAAGNIDKALSAAVANTPILAFYDPVLGKYIVGKLVLVAS